MPLNQNKTFPKRPRLKDFEYTGYYAYFITLLTKDRTDFFRDTNIVKPMIEMIRDDAKEKGFAIDAFCFMPDHLHLLARGLTEKADMRDFIKSFKQKSGYWFKQRYKHNLWQTSYYDHVLRKDESVKDTVLYILCNPVRKGIVPNYRMYPFSGSFTMDISSL